MEIYWLLGIPLTGGTFLGLWGSRKNAPEINAFFSFLTLLAAAFLTYRIVDQGPMIVGEGWFFKMKLSDPSQLDALMDATAYDGLLAKL